jgi:hypothetical protein
MKDAFDAPQETQINKSKLLEIIKQETKSTGLKCYEYKKPSRFILYTRGNGLLGFLSRKEVINVNREPNALCIAIKDAKYIEVAKHLGEHIDKDIPMPVFLEYPRQGARGCAVLIE